MKAILFALLALVLVYVLFVLIASPLTEKDANQISHKGPYTVSQRAKALFTSLDFVADLHCDALLWRRNLTKEANYGHVDFERMQKGNIGLQAFTIVTKSPKGQNFQRNEATTFDMITALSIGQGQPIRTWFSLMNRALYQCKKLHRFASRFHNNFIVVKTKSDFEELLQRRQTDRRVIGGLLGVEGGHCLEGEIENLDRLYKAGVRMLGPTHFFDNEMGGSAHGISGEGLTDFGVEVIKGMQEKRMIMDVAHSSEAIIDDVLEQFNGPILTSHTGVKGTHDSPRNLSDNHLKAIAERGGLIGIAFFRGAIGDTGIPGIIKAMAYTKALVGVEHVALGSDFDGSVKTPFDITGLVLLVEEMQKVGFTEAEIRAIMGGNVKRFLLENLPIK